MTKKDLTNLPATDPLSILRYRDGLYAVDLLTAAICEFDFFTCNATESGNSQQICKRFDFAPRLADVMHDWDVPEIQALLKHSYQSLLPGDLVVVHEAFLNSAKTGPLAVVEYSCILAHSAQGRCYSTLEMANLLAEAGFEKIRSFANAADRGMVLGRKKRGDSSTRGKP